MDIWGHVKDRIELAEIQGDLLRVVESQEQVATLELVDDLNEQSILEELLETAKPAYRPGTETLHYLLATPFRYPPLAYGSRFGARHEPSLFYGSRLIETALAETAYYRFTFWLGMSEPPPSKKLVTQHTVFSARYRTSSGVQLQNAPFVEYIDALVDPVNYATTQQLGTAMREEGVGGFEYLSARDPNRGVNVALFRPEAMACTQPLSQQSWLCETSAEKVSFSSTELGAYSHFPVDTFMTGGAFPQPAA